MSLAMTTIHELTMTGGFAGRTTLLLSRCMDWPFSHYLCMSTDAENTAGQLEWLQLEIDLGWLHREATRRRRLPHDDHTAILEAGLVHRMW